MLQLSAMLFRSKARTTSVTAMIPGLFQRDEYFRIGRAQERSGLPFDDIRPWRRLWLPAWALRQACWKSRYGARANGRLERCGFWNAPFWTRVWSYGHASGPRKPWYGRGYAGRLPDQSWPTPCTSPAHRGANSGLVYKLVKYADHLRASAAINTRSVERYGVLPGTKRMIFRHSTNRNRRIRLNSRTRC